MLVSLMRLQYQYARTGQGWDEYTSARAKLAARMGPPPDNHLQFEAVIGSNAEMPSLHRVVPAYFSAVQTWLAKHGLESARR